MTKNGNLFLANTTELLSSGKSATGDLKIKTDKTKASLQENHDYNLEDSQISPEVSIQKRNDEKIAKEVKHDLNGNVTTILPNSENITSSFSVLSPGSTRSMAIISTIDILSSRSPELKSTNNSMDPSSSGSTTSTDSTNTRDFTSSGSQSSRTTTGTKESTDNGSPKFTEKQSTKDVPSTESATNKDITKAKDVSSTESATNKDITIATDVSTTESATNKDITTSKDVSSSRSSQFEDTNSTTDISYKGIQKSKDTVISESLKPNDTTSRMNVSSSGSPQFSSAPTFSSSSELVDNKIVTNVSSSESPKSDISVGDLQKLEKTTSISSVTSLGKSLGMLDKPRTKTRGYSGIKQPSSEDEVEMSTLMRYCKHID